MGEHDRRTVLIVEDEALIAFDLKEMVERKGLEVMGPFTSATRASKALEQRRPDIALLDINLGDGETSEEIAGELVRQRIPIAFLTGYTEAQYSAPEFADVPRLSKPSTYEDVATLMDELTASLR